MIYVTSVTVSPVSLTLHTGEWYYRIRATVLPVNATCTTLKWTSSDPSIASVAESSGYLRANKPGTVTITATALDGTRKSGSCVVRVIPPTTVTVNPTQLTLYAGETYQLDKTVSDSVASNPEVSWTSSADSVASVNHATGLVSALSAGTTTIRATVLDGLRCIRHLRGYHPAARRGNLRSRNSQTDKPEDRTEPDAERIGQPFKRK